LRSVTGLAGQALSVGVQAGAVSGHGRVDGFLGIEPADAGHQVAERQHAFHVEVGDAEGDGDVLHRASGLHQPREGDPLRGLVGGQPGDVLQQRGFQRRGVVLLGEDGAGQGIDLAAFADDGPSREPAPPPGDDLVGVRFPPRRPISSARGAREGGNAGEVGSAGGAAKLVAEAYRGLAQERAVEPGLLPTAPARFPDDGESERAAWRRRSLSALGFAKA
jgi:hypothetical protein